MVFSSGREKGFVPYTNSLANAATALVKLEHISDKGTEDMQNIREKLDMRIIAAKHYLFSLQKMFQTTYEMKREKL